MPPAPAGPDSAWQPPQWYPGGPADRATPPPRDGNWAADRGGAGWDATGAGPAGELPQPGELPRRPTGGPYAYGTPGERDYQEPRGGFGPPGAAAAPPGGQDYPASAFPPQQPADQRGYGQPPPEPYGAGDHYGTGDPYGSPPPPAYGGQPPADWSGYGDAQPPPGEPPGSRWSGTRPARASGGGLPRNVAAAIAYLPVIALVTAITLLAIDKRRDVRFHAWQSIGFEMVAGASGFIITLTAWLIFIPIAHLLWVLLAVYLGGHVWLLLLAFQNQRYKLPVIGEFAEFEAGRTGS